MNQVWIWSSLNEQNFYPKPAANILLGGTKFPLQPVQTYRKTKAAWFWEERESRHYLWAKPSIKNRRDSTKKHLSVASFSRLWNRAPRSMHSTDFLTLLVNFVRVRTSGGCLHTAISTRSMYKNQWQFYRPVITNQKCRTLKHFLHKHN